MTDFDHIVHEYRVRQRSRGEIIEQMRRARDHFNGDIVIPLPEMERDEKPAVANLMAQGLDQTAMRVASILPNLIFPALQPGKDKNAGSEDWARRRKMAVTGWWQESHMNLKARRMARWTIGYATAPMVVVPDFNTGIPRYRLRNPLSTFPSLEVGYEDDQPNDFIYSYSRTFQWMQKNWPEAAAVFRSQYGKEPKPSLIVSVLEYIDGEERVLGVMQSRAPDLNAATWQQVDASQWLTGGGVELTRVPNRIGKTWGVQTTRLTIDRLQGQFDQVFGIYQNQARLMALESIAVEKAIFPDMALVGTTPGRAPRLVNGKWRDGRTGEINLVVDGRMEQVQSNPGYMGQPLIDRHERNLRGAGNVPAQFSGESPTNIATGRLGSQLLSSTVDFPIQEYQEVMAHTLEQANKVAIAMAKAYFGSEKRQFYVSFGRSSGQADYTPNTHFETDAHFVRYSAPGADVNSLVIGLGQRIGLGTLSKFTAMQQDPLVPDPDFEYRKVTSERLQNALVEFISGMVVQGQIDPQDVVMLWEEVEKGADIATAWRTAQERAQKRQAEAAEKAAEQAQGQPGAEQQPGLSGGPAPEAPPQVAGPTPDMQNLSMMLGSLRQPRPTTAPLGQENAPRQPVG